MKQDVIRRHPSRSKRLLTLAIAIVVMVMGTAFFIQENLEGEEGTPPVTSLPIKKGTTDSTFEPIQTGTWESSDSHIVSISGTTITGEEVGTASIKETGSNATIFVYVYGDTEPEITAAGSCGATPKDNVSWAVIKNGENVLGEDAYTLYLTGNGKMGDNTDWKNSVGTVGNTDRGGKNYSFYTINHVEFGGEITRIGNNAFSNTLISNIVIPEGVLEIGKSVFTWANWLESITLPSSIENLHIDNSNNDSTSYNTFDGAFYLNAISFSNNCDKYAIDNGCLVYFEGIDNNNEERWTIINCPDLLKKDNKDVSIISADNFEKRITSVGRTAFSSCRGLTEINLPSTVDTFEPGSFNKCLKLTSFTIPESTTNFGGNFNGCPNLKEIIINKDKDDTHVIEISSKNMLQPVAYNETCGIGEVAEAKETGVTSIDLSGVVTIGNSAFGKCTGLTSVNLSGVETIGDNAFSGCTGLTSVDFTGVKSIGSSAFKGCTGLTTIDLSSVETIGSSAFYGCNKLNSVSFTKTKDAILTLESNSFKQCALGTTTISFNHLNWDSYISKTAFDEKVTVIYPPVNPDKAVAVLIGQESEVYYNILEEALDDCNENVEVRLLKDYCMPKTYNLNNQTIILDLNGHILTVTRGSHFFANNGDTNNITIKDTSPDTPHYYIWSLNLEGLLINVDENHEQYEEIITICGGAMVGARSTTSGSSILHLTKGTVSINGINFIGNTSSNNGLAAYGAINCSQGTLNIVDSKFIGNRGTLFKTTDNINKDVNKISNDPTSIIFDHEPQGIDDNHFIYATIAGTITKNGSEEPFYCYQIREKPTVTIDTEWTYNDNSKEPTVTIQTDNGLPVLYQYSSSENFETVINKPVNVGDYYVRGAIIYSGTIGFKGTYKQFYTSPVSFSITKADYDMSGVQFESTTLQYNGQIQYPTATGLPTGADGITVTVQYDEGLTDVGSKNITARFSTTSTNYKAPTITKTATLTITPADTTINAVEKIDVNKGESFNITLGLEALGSTLTGKNITVSFNNETIDTVSYDNGYVYTYDPTLNIFPVGSYQDLVFSYAGEGNYGSSQTIVKVLIVDKTIVVEGNDTVVDLRQNEPTKVELNNNSTVTMTITNSDETSPAHVRISVEETTSPHITDSIKIYDITLNTGGKTFIATITLPATIPTGMIPIVKSYNDDGTVYRTENVVTWTNDSVTFTTDHNTLFAVSAYTSTTPGTDSDDSYQQWLQQYYQQLAEQQKQQQEIKEQKEQKKTIAVAVAGAAVIMLSILALGITRRK